MSTQPILATAPVERLTWDEIRARYPDQWVVLVDYDWIDVDDGEFRTAVVAGCGKTRKEALAAAPLDDGHYCEFGLRRTLSHPLPWPFFRPPSP